MIFKSLNSLIILILFILLTACNSLEVFSPKQIESELNISKENKNVIDILNNINNNDELTNIDDFYNKNNILDIVTNSNFTKVKNLKNFGKKYIDTKPLSIFSVDSKLFILDFQSNLKIYDLNNFKIIDNILLDTEYLTKKNIPTSTARIGDNIYIAYTQGNILKIDLNGNKIWEKNFNDILKTPIKIYNNDIIILLSNKIISLNSKNGKINWEFKLESNFALNALGGQIVEFNHLLFVIFPNKKVVEIDTILIEKNNNFLNNISLDNSIGSSYDSIHVYKNLISYFDQNKYLSVYDIENSNFKFRKEIFNNINSFKFFNNLFIVKNKFNNLIAININNNNLFWKINLNDLVNSNEKIINIYSDKKSLFFAFTNGIILEINYIDGSIVSEINIKTKNIIKFTSINNFLFIDKSDGSMSIFKK